MNLRPHQRLRDVDWETIDMLIVPGGHPVNVLGNEDLSNGIRSVHAHGIVAAICGGPTHLAQAGVLKGKRFTTTVFKEHEALFDGATYVDENVVVDGNIVTAWPNAYVDFAFQLADMLHIFKDEAERDWAVRQFKLFQRG